MQGEEIDRGYKSLAWVHDPHDLNITLRCLLDTANAVKPAFPSGSDLNRAGVPAAGGYGQRRSVGRVQLDLDSLRSLAGGKVRPPVRW